LGLFGSSKKVVAERSASLEAKAFQALAALASKGEVAEVLSALASSLPTLIPATALGVALCSNDGDRGGWSLEFRMGGATGDRVMDSDADLLPALTPGSFVLGSEKSREDLRLKTAALSFRDGKMLGAQIFKGRLSLHEDPGSSVDLGDGRLTILAIPLSWSSSATGIAPENIKLGVLLIEGLPLREDLIALLRPFAVLLSQILVVSASSNVDPLTSLASEGRLRAELERQLNLFANSQGKMAGGVVFGLVDDLVGASKVVESELLDDEEGKGARVQHWIAEALSGIGRCVRARALHFPTDSPQLYTAGFAGRLGVNGFAVVLPLLRLDQQVRFARALQSDVTACRFRGMSLLERGGLTVSLRIAGFTDGVDADALWSLLRDELSCCHAAQARYRGQPRLREVVGTLSIARGDEWITYDRWREQRRQATESQRVNPRLARPARAGGAPASGAQRPVGGPPSGPQSRVGGGASGPQRRVGGGASGPQRRVGGGASGPQPRLGGAPSGPQPRVAGGGSTKRGGGPPSGGQRTASGPQARPRGAPGDGPGASQRGARDPERDGR
jgi:hypothetical protein